MSTTISRDVSEVVGQYVAEFSFKITPGARITEAEIRRLCATGADDLIAAVKERAPEVLITSETD